MTVTFNTQILKTLPQFSLDDEAVVMTEEKIETLYKKFFNQEAKTKAKQYPVSHWWVTRIYLTTSETQPAKWFPYDSTTYITGTNLEEGIEEWCDYLGKKSDYTGYKIVTLCLDMLNGTSVVETAFCKEHFQVKEKVYINGPKKKPFPIKASKHYV